MATEWDVFSLAPNGSADPPTLLATLYNAREKSIRVELNGAGSGSFAINRSSPECTEAILAQGNLVKVRIPEIHTDYIFAFFLETGDFTLISSDEAGGEMLTFGGRGILCYLEFARAWSKSYIAGGQDPQAGLWRAYAAGTGAAPGQILRRLIEEFQDPDRPQKPLPYLTIDFDYTNDSTANAWHMSNATDEFTYAVGDDGLDILTRLLETKMLTVQMGADFLLSAFNSTNYGRDLTGAAFGAGVVRFVKGTNIATELRRTLVQSRVATHELVQGEGDIYARAVASDSALMVTKEAFLQAYGKTTAALRGQGYVDLRLRRDMADEITFPIANRRTVVSLADPVTVGAVIGPGADEGFYLPGPVGTNGDFWVGDMVRVHTGTGPFDYDEVDAVVQAITITRDDDNHELIVIPELKVMPPIVMPFAVLYRAQLQAPDAIGPGTSAPIRWLLNGDEGYTLDEPYAPTVGPITFIPAAPLGRWAGVEFGGSGTISIESSFQAFTACNGQNVRVNILLNGAVVATGACTTAGNGGCLITINDSFDVLDGDMMTAEFLHEGTACVIYIDKNDLTIVGITIQEP